MERVIAPLDTIRCPNCRHVIPISQMLSHQIAESAREHNQKRSRFFCVHGVGENRMGSSSTRAHRAIWL
jgi:hypothetical protein